MLTAIGPKGLQQTRPVSAHFSSNSGHLFNQISPAKVNPRPQLSSNQSEQHSIMSATTHRGATLKAKAFKIQDLFGGGLFNNKMEAVEPPSIGFDDVAGVDEAKLELEEVVDFLKNPDKYTKLGAVIPKGVMLSGPPGTGKTLLAKAVAGESGVPFFSASGSEFVEMFVGMGASRVRKLFEKAEANAPCILFIDEIDAMGKSRSGPGGIGGGSDEREQTLNQLLTQMDGFSGNTGVIVIAATNRPDVLDSALLRPGRFDRQVEVNVPDRAGREAILKVHARGKKMGEDVNFNEVAKRTPGFSGADLANILNEAAINTVRRKADVVSNSDIDNAIDSNIAGAKKIGGGLSEKKRELVAYHEAGHAIVAQGLSDFDEVQKVSIEPRGKAAGLTWYTPDEERIDSGLYTFAYLKNTIAVALGGRVAEELAFGEENVTTGASNDLQKVANVARKMVTDFGMSSLGPRAFDTNPLSGQVSANTAKEIDQAVNKLVQEGYQIAKQILTDNSSLLEDVTQALLDDDVITGDQFRELAAKHDLSKNNV